MSLRSISVSLVGCAGLLLGCASTDVAPIESGERPTNLSTDEAGLWLQMDKAEQDIKTSGLLVDDPELYDYVRGVVCRTAGEGYCGDIRLYIMDIPAFNASMAPNGLMMVYTGLLLRAENEAQLAFVLGHEFGHYRERHSLQRFRAVKSAANARLLFAVAVGAAGAPDASIVGDVVLYGRLFGFTRDQEREADAIGYDRMIAAGYDGREAARLWQAIIDEVEQSSSERKKKRLARAGIFATHPLSAERVAYLSERSAGVTGGRVGVISHRNAIRPYLEEWLDRDIARRDLGEHLFLIERLQELGLDDGVLFYRLGEAYRVRRGEGDTEKARDAYAAATRSEDAPPEAWRELGNVEKRLGHEAEARAAYRRYLKVAPMAPDRALVESLASAPLAVTTEEN
ncbi:MAG: M48 family metalloprotease [Parvularcula sp.]